MCRIIAHRGSSGTHPENTMSAFEEARRAGADGIELDVHLTKDQKLVVIHDEWVNRTTNGQGYIQDLTFNEINQLDAGSWFSEAFQGEKIPELSDVLSWSVNHPMILNIELKNIFIDYPGIEKLVTQEVKRFGLEDQVILSSFNHVSLKKLSQQDIKLAMLYTAKLVDPWLYAEYLGVSGLHPGMHSIDVQMVKKAKDAGVDVRIYTVNEEKDMVRWFKAGCTAIITDFPEKARQVRYKVLGY
ncbi:glycerophosphodiester phosphodiesterase [Tenuibacillus multivorans]|uniref:Glycerophosphoryl diester phosphodiesterase n=1 Tax=Tenuibacillus multivorans TaxID=237069 RepID=A0A1H0BS81_9BACI|nr:glycerophosphodiester phosphodiesterase [Tenuibacillus multivorans]GEL77056.1 glycerophosphoryl diester phosphodiesterase [Tenuibacillus multivorans]SDN48440.1 glycerophosphoryl diester phosphodiesterase [Tenuibacillus multivorans]